MPFGDWIACEVGDPAVGVVEKTNCAETRLFAHVKPVPGSSRHADPIVGFARHLKHFAFDMQTKQAASFHEQAHLVFSMGVFA